MRVKGTENCAIIECVDRYKNIWRVRYDFSDDFEDSVKVGVTYQEVEFPHKPTLSDLRDIRVKEVYLADQKASVFYVNDMPMWLNKELRNSLLNVTLPALKARGITEKLLWYEGRPPVSVLVPVDFLLDNIDELEVFATTVYDNTQRLIAEIDNSITEEELYSIEITGYPEPLKFTI